MEGARKRAADFGFNSIGAVATAKVENNDLTAGFPSAYSSVYASKNIMPRFYPRVYDDKHGSFWAGNDLQSAVHEQRRKDANFMAGAKVRATQLSRVRFAGTPHGRGILPPSILGQRVFANPSLGAHQPASARSDLDSAPFHLSNAISSTQSSHSPLHRDTQGFHRSPALSGGVLRSMEGQQHGKRMLDARIEQLNAIQEARQSFREGMPISTGSFQSTETQPVGTNSAIELNLLLQGILNATVGGFDNPEPESASVTDVVERRQDIDRNQLNIFVMKDATRALSLLFALAPQMDSTQLDDVYTKVDMIVHNVDGLVNTEEDTTIPEQTREISLSLSILFKKVREYMEQMIAKSNLSPKERLDLSKALVNSLRFTALLSSAGEDYRKMLSVADKDGLMTPQERQRYRQGDMGVNADGDSWGDDDDDFFSRPAGPREDEEHDFSTGVQRSDRNFTPDVRQEFGAQSGLYYPSGGRGPREWYGEGPPTNIGDVSIGTSTRPRPIQELPMEARPPPRSQANPVQRVPQTPITSYWDRDTQAFNVGTVGRPAFTDTESSSIASSRLRSALAPTRSTASREAEMKRMVTGYNLRKRPRRVRGSVETIPTSVVRMMKDEGVRQPLSVPLPTRQSELPTTREGFIDLARVLRSQGIIVRVYEGSTMANIRKNFIKRLGLAGKR